MTHFINLSKIFNN